MSTIQVPLQADTFLLEEVRWTKPHFCPWSVFQR